jgi:hypothetical protein
MNGCFFINSLFINSLLSTTYANIFSLILCARNLLPEQIQPKFQYFLAAIWAFGAISELQ